MPHSLLLVSALILLIALGGARPAPNPGSHDETGTSNYAAVPDSPDPITSLGGEESTGEIILNATAEDEDLVLQRTFSFGKSRCALKVICYFSTQGELRETYAGSLYRHFHNVWDYFLGENETPGLTRTHGHQGCILSYNSCPMNIVNAVQLAMNLQRSDEEARGIIPAE
ncbi:uncharacterized protein LOC100904691 [Galendromus occidentalis]|uniref:Uncharacterized protein LOC100904691 n=1 Tax=Galendromus occidentalis TaxID=34638 RepID=A0AAJ6QNW2_9ACAR|nr:uncharacterized protein LOC100904691 [Galendromus occidentalis]